MAVKTAYPKHTVWPDLNLFFGGAHTVLNDDNDYSAIGDPRRGGVAIVAS